MTETISNVNAAASTLFLGHTGEWWDFWLIASVIVAALAATTIGVTTAGSIVSHKRETLATEMALERFKLETESKISAANRDAAQAKLDLQHLQQLVAWRRISKQEHDKIVEVLRAAPFAVTLGFNSNDPESSTYADDIAKTLKDAGMAVTLEPELFATPMFGLIIWPTSDEVWKRLRDAFRGAEVPFVDNGAIHASPKITVGIRPRPY